MKTRIFSLLAVLLFCVTSNVSALRVQSLAIAPLQVSQLASPGSAPEQIQGKVWGKAPAGEVTHISYRIVDAGGAITWEYTVPFEKTFTGAEELDIPFVFDLANVFADEDSTLIVQLQRQTMNGAFAQTIARGEMGLIFPKKIQQERMFSRIEKTLSFVDAQNIVVQTQFKNIHNEGKFYAKAKLFDVKGVLLREIDSVKKTVLTDGTAEFSVLFDIPGAAGRYKTEVQIFEENEPVTGLRTESLIVEGEFALISEIKVVPEDYFYVGEEAAFEVSGASSSWGAALTMDFTVTDVSGVEIFTKEFPLQTDEIGRFTQEIAVPIQKETAQLQTHIELRRGSKVLGTYTFKTQQVKKPHATEGQSAISFALERMSQDFMLGTMRDKVSIVVSFLILLALLVGFIFFVRHVRKTHLLLLLLGFSFLSTEVFAEDISFEYPHNGWTANPSSEDGFQKLRFKGAVGLGTTTTTFPFNAPITATVQFEESTATAQTVFTTQNQQEYDFIIDVPTALVDGIYSIVVAMTWEGIPFSDEVLEIEFLVEDENREAVPLLIESDKTPPGVDFEYFAGDDLLGDNAFTREPVKTRVVCNDTTGCFYQNYSIYEENIFKVSGNFCSGADFCPEDAVDEFVVCDEVMNCSSPTQIEIRHYDPIAPSLESIKLVQNTSGGLDVLEETDAPEGITIKAVSSYIFSFFGLDDLGEIDTVDIELDESACGDLDKSSPFVSDEGVCKEKLVRCILSPNELGILAYDSDECSCECPEGFVSVGEEGDCYCEQQGCSNVGFPYCFEWILNGRCETFPFCFKWILE